MPATHLRLVAVDGSQVAAAPRRRVRDAVRREEREIMLAIIKEHPGHLTHSVSRIQSLGQGARGEPWHLPAGSHASPFTDLPRPDVSA
jgi:hypothetical protein